MRFWYASVFEFVEKDTLLLLRYKFGNRFKIEKVPLGISFVRRVLNAGFELWETGKKSGASELICRE